MVEACQGGPTRGVLSVPFDPQPVLSGTLVHVRPLRPGDYDDLYAVASDPLIWEQHPESNRHEAAVFRRFFAEAIASGGALLVTDVSTREVIGSSRYHGFQAGTQEVEIGWTFLARSHWGGRYNAELKHLMLHHAFRSVTSVIFRIGPANHRSRRAVERLGAMLEPQREDQGRVVYRITAATYRGTVA